MDTVILLALQVPVKNNVGAWEQADTLEPGPWLGGIWRLDARVISSFLGKRGREIKANLRPVSNAWIYERLTIIQELGTSREEARRSAIRAVDGWIQVPVFSEPSTTPPPYKAEDPKCGLPFIHITCLLAISCPALECCIPHLSPKSWNCGQLDLRRRLSGDIVICFTMLVYNTMCRG